MTCRTSEGELRLDDWVGFVQDAGEDEAMRTCRGDLRGGSTYSKFRF